ASAADGNIYVFGGIGNDNIYVNANNPNNVLITINGSTILNPAVGSGGKWTIVPAGHRIVIVGDAGNDFLQLSGAVNGELLGGAGADTLSGGAGNDVMLGEAGDDYLDGTSGGNDVLVGGAGADRLFGNTGNSVEVGGDFIAGSRNGNNW